MIVYHSSAVVVDAPDIFHSRRYLDFGKGFYLTTIYEQAVRYAERFLRRGRTAWVNYYSFFAGELTQDQALGLLKFEKPNIQYCIRSEKMLNECLTYIKSEQL